MEMSVLGLKTSIFPLRLLFIGLGVFLGFCVAMPSVSSAKSRVLKIAGDNSCPLNCDPKADGVEGFIVEAAREIFKPLGWNVTYELQPWKRVIANLYAGKVDAALTAVHLNGGHDPEGIFTKVPEYTGAVCFYVAANSNWQFNDFSKESTSLKTGVLGVIAGYDYPPEMQSYIDAHKHDGKIDVTTSQDGANLAFKKLASGRIDFFLTLDIFAKYRLSRLALTDKVKVNKCPIKKVNLYILFGKKNKNSQELADAWDSSYEAFLKSDKGKSLLRKYDLKHPLE
ncbi:substrate-binding periplasmic protein [Bdellovibrio sp. HCB288]|uniref:substrate-binding periplasmic protein n=1 Tax=Bdellovibrio sp. HCB288 TaxID=3394355 RepID=UPI0039B4D365